MSKEREELGDTEDDPHEDIHEAIKDRKQAWEEMKRRARKQYKRDNRD